MAHELPIFTMLFINKILLEYSHKYSFIYCLWLIWRYDDKVEYLQQDFMTCKIQTNKNSVLPEFVFYCGITNYYNIISLKQQKCITCCFHPPYQHTPVNL